MVKKGFTLVELLAVILIIALLSALVIPNIIEMGNDYKDIGNSMFEDTVKNAAKMYVKGSQSVQNEVKTNTKKSISYKTLIDKGYLNEQSVSSLKTGSTINYNTSYVCVRYSGGTYSYTIGACN